MIVSVCNLHWCVCFNVMNEFTVCQNIIVGADKSTLNPSINSLLLIRVQGSSLHRAGQASYTSTTSSCFTSEDLKAITDTELYED